MKQGLILLTMLLGFGLLFAACGGSGGSGNAGNPGGNTDPNANLPDCPAVITIQGLAYSPAACKTKVGTAITISASVDHPLQATSSPSPIPEAPTLSGRQVTFASAGTYTYKCVNHADAGMVGRIVVVP